MATVVGVLQQASLLSELSESGRLDVELLLCRVLNKERTWLFSWPEAELSAEQDREFQALFQRRLKGEPIAHILGEREFWSLSLQVNTSTLIPRPDTELLVELSLELAEQELLPRCAKVIDLGTGTGAVALALASEKSLWQISGIDFKAEAVELALNNAQRLELERVNFYQSSWFEDVSDQKFDLIVSNPPYIEEDDVHLTQGDVRFEPLSALTAGVDGLSDIRRIVIQAPDYLEQDGWLLLEHGYNQGESVRTLLQDGGFVNVSTRQDLAGLDRVTMACLKSA